MKKMVGILLAIAIPVFILLTSVQVMVEWDEFFYKEYQKNGVVETTQIQIEELMNITDEIQDYLLGDREDFIIEGVVDGQVQQVFNEREIIHMKDVKDLFTGGIAIRNICAILIIGIALFLWKKDKGRLYQSMLHSSIGFVVLGVTLAVLLLSNFNKYFTIFHEIFFRNDFWILDPDHSVLINMVDLNFFMNISARILGGSLVFVLVIGILGYIGLKKERRQIC